MDTEISNYNDDDIWSQEQFPNKVAVDEDILLVTRRDFAIIGVQFISGLALFVFLLLIRTFLIGLWPQAWSLALYDIMMYGINTWLLLRFALQFHNYYLSMEIVTNYRIIDVDQHGLFKREVNQLSLEKIEDVSYRQIGIVQLLLNYGDVVVQTASGMSDSSNSINGFVFNDVPHPREVSTFIGKLYQEFTTNNQQQQAELQAREILKAFK